MGCADVDVEFLLFFAFLTWIVIAVVFQARGTQRWLRDHPRLARNAFFLFFGRERLLEERNLRYFRFAFGAVPLLIWVGSWLGVYCYFHGPDYPPHGR